MSKSEDEERAPKHPWLALAGIGFEFSGMIIGGIVLGRWIDGYFQSTPWGMVGGLLCGAIGAFWQLIRLLNFKNRDE